MLPVVHLPFIGTSLTTYSIAITIYLLVALPLTVTLARSQGVSGSAIVTLFLLAVPSGVIGSRTLDAFEYWGAYQSVADLLGRRGSSIYGGLMAGFSVAYCYARARNLPPLSLLDAGAPAVALGEAATRVGCFLNGCCYGTLWHGPFAVTFPPGSYAFEDQLARGLIASSAPRSLPVHPVQLYSVVVMLVASAVLTRQYLRPHREGTIFFALLIAYGLLRLTMAPLRMEALNSMKIFSLIFIAVGIFGLRRRREMVLTFERRVA